MKLIIASVSLLSFMACVEPEATVDPIAHTRAVASEPAVDVVTENVPADGVAEHALQCGDGSIYYWDWACLNDGNGWTLVQVGSREFACDVGGGVPMGGPLVGRITTCKSSDQSECSTALPSSTCSYEPYGAAHCNLPKPTTWCYTRGVLPPLPPIVPPGGANG